MKELNSAQMGVAGGSICRLPRPIAFPAGRGCARTRAEATITAKQVNAVAQTLTGASAKAMLACIFDTSTLRFGDKRPEIVDTSIQYARAREQFIAQTMDDFLISCSTYNGGIAKRVRDIADADVIAPATAQNATAVLVVEFSRAFELARLGQDAYSYCPGATQMRQIQWEFIRSGTFEATGNWVQAQAADVLFIADDFEASDDVWAFVPRIYQQEEAGRESHGPKGGAGLITMWEYTSAGGATALTLFTIKREDDVPTHDNVRASRVIRDALYTDPIGAYDLNAVATVLQNLPGDGEKADIPVGHGFTLTQTGAELNPPKTAWLHIPVYTEEQVDAYVGANVEDALGVKAIRASAKSGKSMSSAAASLEPVVLARKDGSDFESLPGRVYATGIAPTTHVPAPVMAAATAQVGAASGPEAKRAAGERAGKALAKAVPGWLSGKRGRRSVAQAGIAQRLGG